MTCGTTKLKYFFSVVSYVLTEEPIDINQLVVWLNKNIDRTDNTPYISIMKMEIVCMGFF